MNILRLFSEKSVERLVRDGIKSLWIKGSRCGEKSYWNGEFCFLNFQIWIIGFQIGLWMRKLPFYKVNIIILKYSTNYFYTGNEISKKMIKNKIKKKKML